jgi:glyoxylase-like metal-dependent hydrolase (beta-lactamase superfamily II)
MPVRTWDLREGEPTRSWTVGSVTVTKVSEMVLEGGLDEVSDHDFLGDATREVLRNIDWLIPDFVTPTGEVRLCFHSVVIETPNRRIVVDTCVGNDKQRPAQPFWTDLHTPFLESLDAAGYPPESIDTVICTHMHVDHVGWNTRLIDGLWTPTFPNARYLIGSTESAFWAGRLAEGNDGTSLHPAVFFADSIEPLFSAGVVDLVEMDAQICPEVSLVPSAGHTPGHVCVRIDSEGQTALITGDAIHHPSQLLHPEWRMSADVDGAAAAVARRRLLEELADTSTLVIGTHWGGRTAGLVTREGSAFRLR